MITIPLWLLTEGIGNVVFDLAVILKLILDLCNRIIEIETVPCGGRTVYKSTTDHKYNMVPE